MLPSAATTVYVTGPVKLLAVVPLVCVVVPTLTEAPVEAKVAIKAITSVPKGTVKTTVFADSLIVAVTAGLVKLKAVNAFAVFETIVTVTM